MSEWISVEERLPEGRVTVLIYSRVEGIQPASYLYKDSEWIGADDDDLFVVTHWMPLPAPPEGQ